MKLKKTLLGIIIFCSTTVSAQLGWELGGNTISTGSFLGTTNNEDLIFKANGVEGFRLKASNNKLFVKVASDFKKKVTLRNDLQIKLLQDPMALNDRLIGVNNSGIVKVVSSPILSDLTITNNFTASGSINAQNGITFFDGTVQTTAGIISPWQANGTDIHFQTGKVGIGTTNPLTKLHVNGNLRVENGLLTSQSSFNTIPGTANNSWMRDSWLTGNYGPPIWNDIAAQWYRGTGTYNDIGGIVFQDEGTYFIRDGASSDLFMTNDEFLSKAYMFADIVTGNVGIGTQDPNLNQFMNYELNIRSTNGKISFGDNALIGDPNGGVNCLVGEWGTGGLDSDIIQVHGKKGIKFTTNSQLSEVMFIARNGNVGIGIVTTNQLTENYKLSVEGNIRAREIEVNATTWADYVFDTDYYLAPLTEVEEYITENNHLPNVPSEEEVLEEGINLGEMDAILLRKIEELTLYIIELEKKVEANISNN